MFWNIIFHTLNAEKTKTKEKGLKSYYKKMQYPYVYFTYSRTSFFQIFTP